MIFLHLSHEKYLQSALYICHCQSLLITLITNRAAQGQLKMTKTKDIAKKPLLYVWQSDTNCVGEVRNCVGELKQSVGEMKDSVGETKRFVGEIKQI